MQVRVVSHSNGKAVNHAEESIPALLQVACELQKLLQRLSQTELGEDNNLKVCVT